MKIRGRREDLPKDPPRHDDIGDVLRRLGIDARKRGTQWVALCPNHEDHDPSWRIRDQPGTDRHGKHWCHACGWGGSIFFLVMEVRGCDHEEAAKWLGGAQAEAAPVTHVDVKVGRKLAGWSLPAEVQIKPIEKWVSGARKYALGRGITPWQIERWGIGFSVDGDLGCRIVIPYRRPDGVPVGYTARTWVDDPKRYDEAAGGAGRSAVFGEQHWPTFSREKVGTVFVVEGALNALAVERALVAPASESNWHRNVGGFAWRDHGFLYPPSFPNLASLAGSDPGAGRLVKLFRFERVVLLTDPDDAGDRVAAALSSQLARHADFLRVRLPRGCDAADLGKDDLRSTVLSALGDDGATLLSSP